MMASSSSSNSLLNLFLIFIFFRAVLCVSLAETHTIKPGQQLRDWEQLVSANGVFKLGFFTPEKAYSPTLGSAGPRYIGIWFAKLPTDPVWVGNAKDPVLDSSAALTIDTNGVLKITQALFSPVILSTKPQRSLAGNMSVSATLLDSGNFVVRHVGRRGAPGRVLWQSFDYPTNVLLPGMKIGFNLKTKQELSVISWTSNQVPAPGAFRLGLDPFGADQLLVWRRNEVYWSSGIWKENGTSRLSLEFSSNYIDYEFKFYSDKHERYFTYSIKQNNGSVLSRWDLDTLGQITVSTAITSKDSGHYIFESSEPCSVDSKNQSAICIREKPMACRKGSEYFEPKRGYMEDNGYFETGSSLSLSDCHGRCWRNCSCVAFQTFSDGTACQFWAKGSQFLPMETLDQLTYVLGSAKY